MVKLRLPHIFNLRRDPFERADFNSNTYWDWMVDHVPQLYQCQAVVAAQIENFVKYPAAPEGGLIQPRRGDGIVGASTGRSTAAARRKPQADAAGKAKQLAS